MSHTIPSHGHNPEKLFIKKSRLVEIVKVLVDNPFHMISQIQMAILYLIFSKANLENT